MAMVLFPRGPSPVNRNTKATTKHGQNPCRLVTYHDVTAGDDRFPAGAARCSALERHSRPAYPEAMPALRPPKKRGFEQRAMHTIDGATRANLMRTPKRGDNYVLLRDLLLNRVVAIVHGDQQ